MTRLLQKLDPILTKLQRINDFCETKNKEAFSVAFKHAEDRQLLGMYWSDQSYMDRCENYSYEYVYHITSRGIHFVSFFQKRPTDRPWNDGIKLWNIYGNGNIALTQVPNIGPVPGTTMYVFHQEKIREALSALPAWAIVCGTDY